MKVISHPPLVRVLLSTFNGERYLDEQLESLASQIDARIDLLVRDDGSSDTTLSILERWRDRLTIKIIKGENKGAVASFLELVAETDLTADYYAFCDQDDVWLPEKIATATARLSELGEESPGLYCSALRVTDSDLNPRYDSPPPRLPITFGNALVQNVATGCSVVVNRAAISAARISRVDTRSVIMHDWWMLLIASSLGSVVFDPVPRVLYRQHGRNEVGHSRGLSFWRMRARRFMIGNKTGMLRKQASAFNAIYGSKISSEKRNLLEVCLGHRSGLMSAIFCVRRDRLYRQSKIDDCILRILFALGKV